MADPSPPPQDDFDLAVSNGDAPAVPGRGSNWGKLGQKLLLLLTLMAIALGLGWGAGQLWLRGQQRAALEAEPEVGSAPKTDLEIKNEIRTRRINTGLSAQRFQRLIIDGLEFKLGLEPRQFPDQNLDLPGTGEQQQEVTLALLTATESLSSDGIRYLSQNTSGDRRRWVPRVNQLRLSSRSFSDLVNARFQHYLPFVSRLVLEEPEFGDRPLAQLWNAMAFDTLASLEEETHYQRLDLGEELTTRLQGTLEPGQGHAYAINIPGSDNFQLQLTAPPDVQISFYSPTGQQRMLENSRRHQWSGPLQETGYYELVITATGEEPVDFQLSLQTRPMDNFDHF